MATSILRITDAKTLASQIAPISNEDAKCLYDMTYIYRVSDWNSSPNIGDPHCKYRRKDEHYG